MASHKPTLHDDTEQILRGCGNPERPRAGLLDCGHRAIGHEAQGAAGYATTPSGRTVCYPCAEEHEREAMHAAAAAGAPFGAYLDSDGRHITTWTGAHLARVTRETFARGFHGSTITRVSATDPHGRRWHGAGSGRGMYLTIRPGKETNR